MQYIAGIIGVIIGFLIVWKANWLMENLGRIAWAEQHLGSGFGGTRLLYKLIGIGVIILSFLLMGGVLKGILEGVFAPKSPV